MEALLLGFEEVQELRKAWTTEQHRQSSAAMFYDHDLSFTLPAPSSSTAGNAPLDPLRPPVHHEVVLDAVALNAEGLDFVGGLDISFREDGSGDEGIATLAVLSWPDLKVIHSISRSIQLLAPYIPSFLSFREAEPLAALVDELRAQKGSPIPQLLFVDGNGRLHPREAGSAVAIGLLTGLPTIGIGKEYHALPAPLDPPPTPLDLPYPPNFRSTQKGMRSAAHHLLPTRGSWFPIHSPCPPFSPLGAALLSSPKKGSTNPVFVSAGHRLSLDSAVRITLASCSLARVPEPVRQADAIGREESRRVWGRKLGVGESGEQ